jgi:Spy/CpxP family protein refolding chaperone
MKKGIITSLIITLVVIGATAAFAFGPGYGMGMGAGYGTCPQASGTVSPEQSQKFAKFQSDILPLKQKMLQLRTDLMTLRAQTPIDWNAVSAKQKEMVDVRTAIQKQAASPAHHPSSIITPKTADSPSVPAITLAAANGGV